jgi:hypothetical protein
MLALGADFGRLDTESGVKPRRTATACGASRFEAAALPGRLEMTAFWLVLMFLGIATLTYGLLNIPRRTDSTPD